LPAKLLKNPGDFDAAHARCPARGLSFTAKSFHNVVLAAVRFALVF
jgi:hypothetical protein